MPALAPSRCAKSTAHRPPPGFGLGHVATPVALLDLASKLYGRAPVAFLVTVGVSSVALGEALSDTAAAALPVAIATVRQLLAERLAEG